MGARLPRFSGLISLPAFIVKRRGLFLKRMRLRAGRVTVLQVRPSLIIASIGKISEWGIFSPFSALGSLGNIGLHTVDFEKALGYRGFLGKVSGTGFMRFASFSVRSGSTWGGLPIHAWPFSYFSIFVGVSGIFINTVGFTFRATESGLGTSHSSLDPLCSFGIYYFLAIPNAKNGISGYTKDPLL